MLGPPCRRLSIQERRLNSESLHAMRGDFHTVLTAARAIGADRLARLAAVYSADVAWHDSYPLKDCSGPAAITRGVWQPLLAAFAGLERRDETLIASEWEEEPWIAATGSCVGRFRDDWIGIPATGRVATLRFGEFSKMRAGLVCSGVWDPYTVELYPEHLRATAASIFNCGRTVSLFGTLLAGAIAVRCGLPGVMYAGAVTFAAAAMLWWSFPETLQSAAVPRPRGA